MTDEYKHNRVICRRDGTISYASRAHEGHWVHDAITVPESELACMTGDIVRKIRRHIARSARRREEGTLVEVRSVEDANEDRRRYFQRQRSARYG